MRKHSSITRGTRFQADAHAKGYRRMEATPSTRSLEHRCHRLTPPSWPRYFRSECEVARRARISRRIFLGPTKLYWLPFKGIVVASDYFFGCWWIGLGASVLDTLWQCNVVSPRGSVDPHMTVFGNLGSDCLLLITLCTNGMLRHSLSFPRIRYLKDIRDPPSFWTPRR